MRRISYIRRSSCLKGIVRFHIQNSILSDLTPSQEYQEKDQCCHTAIGGDPENMSSSSEKKDATSCVDIPKSLKAHTVVCRIGGLGPAVGRVAAAQRRFIWFFDEDIVVCAFLLNKPGRSDTESGRCDGEMSSRRSTGTMGC